MAGIEAPRKTMAKKAAAAAASLRGLLSLAADVVVIGFFATLWLTNAANAAAVAVRWACGEGSRATAFAREFAMASSHTMGLLLVASLLVLLRRRASRNRNRNAVAREVGGDEEATRRPATQSPENTGGRRSQDALCGPVTTPILAFFLVLVGVGVLMEELARGRDRVRAGLVPCLLT